MSPPPGSVAPLDPVALVALVLVTLTLAAALSRFLSAPAGGRPAKGLVRVLVGRLSELEASLAVGKHREAVLALPGGGKATILLIRTGARRWRATGAKCTHANAPLAGGVLCGDRVSCPLHDACFSTVTGEVEEGPGLDAIPIFSTSIVAGALYADVPAQGAAPTAFSRTPCPAAAKAGGDARSFVIIGGGAAAHAAAETLRREGFSGSVTLLNREGGLPYERPKTSKALDSDIGELVLRPRKWYAEQRINIRESVIAASVEDGAVVLTNGERIAYDALLCASGGAARTFRASAEEGFSIEGADLVHVHVLRTIAHANTIDARAEAVIAAGGAIVVQGSSFVGMEVAAYLVSVKKATRVTVIGMEAVPFERVLGPRIGALMQALHEARGVKFRMGATVTRFVGQKGGAVKGVELKGGEVLPADLVIIGAGIIPATSYLKNTPGVQLLARAPGGIVVDEFLQAAPGIWAAGDVAYFPYRPTNAVAAHGTRIEHWDVAINHGRCAALNMLGRRVAFNKVPFFWTTQFGKSLRYAGHASACDDVIFFGTLDTDKPTDASFVAFFVVAGTVAAVATLARDPQAVAAAELLRLGSLPSVTTLRELAAGKRASRNNDPQSPRASSSPPTIDLVAILAEVAPVTVEGEIAAQ